MSFAAFNSFAASNMFYHTTAYKYMSPYALANISTNSSQGASVSTNGNYTVFTYNSSGTFTVSQPGYVSVLIVGGGGGGGWNVGGGGGAGGMVFFDLVSKPMTLTATSYAVTVGTGGSKSTVNQTNGTNGND